MDFAYTEQENAFRDEVRDWIDKNIPGDYGSSDWPIPEDPEELSKLSFDWMRTMYDGGWTGVTWPKEYGGREATPTEPEAQAL